MKKNYIEQDGCHNCGFVLLEYTSNYEWLEPFCTYKAPKPPDVKFSSWEKWAEGKDVRDWGKCDNWKKEK